jgi:PAS domain S-box-containing protein
MDKFKQKIERTDDLKTFIEQQQAIIEEKRAEIFRLKSVIEKLPGSIYWKDRNGVYLGCNEFVLKMAGARHDKEIIGKTDFNMPWKRYAEELRIIDKKVLKTELPVEIEESPVLADGQQVVVLTNKVPLRDENGDVIGIISISVDITERKQMEAILEDTKNKAELANQTKMAFLENMRHDIRTPLTGIIGCADILN